MNTNDQIIEARLSDGAILAFDGRVLEILGRNETRIHIAHIQNVAVNAKSSDYTIHVNANPHGGFILHFDAKEKARIDALVTAIRQASW